MEKLPLLYQWNFNFTIAALVAILTVIYYRLGSLGKRQTALPFWSSILLLIISECSPLHYLGMHFYFSAHMISHVILLLVCGPLLTIGIPENNSAVFIKNSSSLINRHGWVAWIAGVGIMWFWHVPFIFDWSFSAMGQAFSFIFLMHIASLLVAGIIFSYPIFGPLKDLNAHPLTGVVYLFTACVSCSILGLLITFAPPGTYYHYSTLDAHMSMGQENPWHLSLQNDQQAAGLIMWVPCCFVYLSGCLLLLQRWFAQTDKPGQKEISIN